MLRYFAWKAECCCVAVCTRLSIATARRPRAARSLLTIDVHVWATFIVSLVEVVVVVEHALTNPPPKSAMTAVIPNAPTERGSRMSEVPSVRPAQFIGQSGSRLL